MKKDLLFQNRYRRIGWLLFFPSTFLGLFTMYGDSVAELLGIQTKYGGVLGSFADEVAAVGVILGLLFIAFAREKTEDEMIRQLRLESLQWSVYVNYFLLALAIIFVYDGPFFTVLVYNMFTILVVFIARFRWLLKRVEQTDDVLV